MDDFNKIIISGLNLDEHLINIDNLFLKAKQIDEFEFGCTILRIRGIEGPGWDTYIQSYNNFIRLTEIMNNETDFEKQAVLMLQLYVQCTEVSDIYNILINLIRVSNGDRYSFSPFNQNLYSSRINSRYPQGKILRVKEQSKLRYNNKLADLFEFLYVRQVRNAVSHSDYTIYDGKFRIISGEGVNINQVITSEIPFEWLVPRVNAAINTCLVIYNNIIDHIKSYQEDKIISGRLGHGGSYTSIQLIADKNGLKGFKTPPDKELIL